MKKLGLILIILALLAVAVIAVPREALPLEERNRALSEAWVSVGNYLYKEGNVNLAVGAYERSLYYHDTARAHHNLGFAAYEAGQTETALTHFRRAVELDPTYVQGRSSLALILFQQGELEEASEHFDALTQLQPHNAQAHFDLGVTLANSFREGGDVELLIRAQNAFARTLEIDPQHPYASRNLEVTQEILDVYHVLK